MEASGNGFINRDFRNTAEKSVFTPEELLDLPQHHGPVFKYTDELPKLDTILQNPSRSAENNLAGRVARSEDSDWEDEATDIVDLYESIHGNMEDIQEEMTQIANSAPNIPQ